MTSKNHIALSRFSIKDIETITGIKAHTLRIWEQRYNFIKPKRTGTNIRYYDDHDLRYILNVSILNNYGVKISEIAKMSFEKIQEMVLLISEKSSPYANQVKALILTMFNLDEAAFNKLLTANINRIGMEATMSRIVFPFMHHIGVLWLTGAVHPAQEHFISNLVRQKLYVAIDSQTGKERDNAKKFLLFLPEGEPHEIGLLFANYIIRARGHQVVYLGQNQPFEDLQHVFNLYEPEYILSSLTSGTLEENVQQLTDNFAKTWPAANILLTGHKILSYPDLRVPSNVRVLKDIDALVEILDTLNKELEAGVTL